MSKSLSFKLFQENNLILEKNKIEYNTNQGIISFIDEDITFNIDINNKIFTRENNEFKFVLNINNNSCIYTLKETNTSLDINVINSSFKNENELIIEYKLESAEENIKLIINMEE